MKKLLGLLVVISLVACNAGNNENSRADSDSVSLAKPDSMAYEQLNDGHNAQNSLDWFGAYEGTLPCADCEGIKTTIVLNQDNTFNKTAEYLGKKDGKFTEDGKIQWHENGREITLLPAKGEPEIYTVKEGSLVMLDKDGKEVTGDLASHYILQKK